MHKHKAIGGAAERLVFQRIPIINELYPVYLQYKIEKKEESEDEEEEDDDNFMSTKKKDEVPDDPMARK